jgi:hypothetical protein
MMFGSLFPIVTGLIGLNQHQPTRIQVGLSQRWFWRVTKSEADTKDYYDCDSTRLWSATLAAMYIAACLLLLVIASLVAASLSIHHCIFVSLYPSIDRRQ